MRSLEYVNFILYEKKIDAHIIAAGDDVLLISDEHNYLKFEKSWREYFSETGTGEHGLGQYVKEVKRYPINTYEFLSKFGVYNYIEDLSGLYRQHERMLFIQTMSDSKQPLRILKEALANSI